MKQLARSLVVSILGWQTRRLQKKHGFKTIAVAGSIGKTSTKFAIAQLLSAQYRVRWQEGNYNDLVSVPLVYFGQALPSLFNPFAWLAVFVRCEIQLHKPYPYDVVVVEVGTDGPGQIAAFKRYLHVDIAVLTAITPEHMEYFKDIDDVAKEELSVVQYSKSLLLNTDFVAHEYRSLVPEAVTYATTSDAEYLAQNIRFNSEGVTFDVHKEGEKLVSVTHSSISTAQLSSLLAAIVVAETCGMGEQAIVAGIGTITPVSGRLQVLAGSKQSRIIDDTYNSSPEAAQAALETLYRIDAPQKIALLGAMNELGDYSRDAHIALGRLCDASQIDELITLGPDANEYLAPAAEAKGCKVKRCTTPTEAGEYVASVLKPGALVLAKGSQNKVYAEEAVKLLLADPADAQKLVRQSPEWLKIKANNFAHS